MGSQLDAASSRCLADGRPQLNLTAIVILSRRRCGLSKCITCYLVAMAVGDLLVVIAGVIMNRVIGIYFPLSALSYTLACRLKTILVFMSRDFSVWLTVAFTFDRLVAICCQNLKTKYCTEKTVAVNICIVFVLSSLQYVPLYLGLEPLYFVNSVPMFCGTIPGFYTIPVWVAYSWINDILTPWLALSILILFNALTIRHIFVSNRVRRTLRGINSGSDVDPELESRRKSIILLFSISGNVVLLWATYMAHHLYYRITNTYVYSGYNDPIFILQEAGHMLLLLSCCTNTCIYVITQKKFREELQNGLKYPLTLIMRFIK
ncbi:putative G-protein coupled receptor 139 [Rhinoraja longicauda]